MLKEESVEIQLAFLQPFINNFDDEMIKANRTMDYRTISRRLMDMTSVYNLMV